MNKKKLLFISLFILIVLIIIFIKYLATPKQIGDPTINGLTLNKIESAQKEIEVETTKEATIQEVATNLEIPWEIVFLPNESLLVTQRAGTLLHIKPNQQKTIEISGVKHTGEGGLLGLALHPQYESNHWIYLYLTSQTNSGLENRVERYTFNEELGSVSQKTVIIDHIPGATYHDGGRILFGPDGYLYITTGDAGNSSLAQNKNSIAGKFLRLTDTGEIPEGNPFNNEVYSYGHRNPQGLAWDSNGRLWATEHGPSGINTGYDEVNQIMIGENYGWPTITGSSKKTGLQTPLLQSGSSNTWAPAGLVIHNDMLFFTGLRGEGLYTAKIDGSRLTQFTKHFSGEFGRLRAITLDPSNQWLYISTSNKDGRGSVKTNDDKIIKINLSVF